MDDRPPPRAYILAGGKSSRFGSDKARVVIDGMPNLRSLAMRLVAFNIPVTIVAQSLSDYSDLGLRTITDFERNAGPFAGTLTALLDAKSFGANWSLILTCDLLWRNNTWLEKILSASQSDPASSEPPILAWLFQGESFLPFPGLYHTDAWIDAQRCWEQGVRSMRGWLQPQFHPRETDRGKDRDQKHLRPNFSDFRIGYVPLPVQDIPGSYNTNDELRDQLNRTDDRA